MISLLLSITQPTMNPYTQHVIDMINANNNKINSNTDEINKLKDLIQSTQVISDNLATENTTLQNIHGNNPIIKKILPFLPYEINDIILTKLNEEKIKFLHTTKINKLLINKLKNTLAQLKKMIHNRKRNLTYPGTWIVFAYSVLDWIHYHEAGLIRFQRGSGPMHYSIINLNKEILENNTYTPEFKNELYKITENAKHIMNHIYTQLRENMNIIDSVITRERKNTTITIFDNTYKIYKSNKTVNPKPFNKFIEDFESYLQRIEMYTKHALITHMNHTEFLQLINTIENSH